LSLRSNPGLKLANAFGVLTQNYHKAQRFEYDAWAFVRPFSTSSPLFLIA